MTYESSIKAVKLKQKLHDESEDERNENQPIKSKAAKNSRHLKAAKSEELVSEAEGAEKSKKVILGMLANSSPPA